MNDTEAAGMLSDADSRKIRADENGMIDIFKFLFSLSVMVCHMKTYQDLSVYGGVISKAYWMEFYIINRQAVPFFFLCAGYFLGINMKHSHNRKRYIVAYLKRILCLYVLWTMIFAPYLMVVYDHLLEFLKDFFLTGQLVHFWFFPSLLVAVVISVISYRFMGNWALLCSAIFYLLGMYLQSVDNGLTEAYTQIFETSRNGIFFGYIFVLTGYCIGKSGKQKISRRRLVAEGILVILSYACVMIETMICWGQGVENLNFLTLIFSGISTFLLVKDLGDCSLIREGSTKVFRILRKSSTIIYCSHMWLPCMVSIFAPWLPLWVKAFGVILFTMSMVIIVLVGSGKSNIFKYLY